MNILVVDDDLTSREIFRSIIQEMGFQVTVFSGGTELMNYIDNSETVPEIILLDWMMPDLDGLTLCSMLKSDERTKHIYIILLTAKTSTEEMVEGLNAGADDFISKPPNMAILKARIDAGIRIVNMHKEVASYGEKMSSLAEERAKQLVHADRMTTIGVLSAGIAHEINNPTSFIAVNIQTLEDSWPMLEKCLKNCSCKEFLQQLEPLIDEIPVIIKEMKNGVIRIKEIVAGLKTYVHIDNKKAENVNINELLEDALKICHNRLKYNIKVIKKYDQNIPLVSVVKSQIEQVFINLIINSVDAIEMKKSAESNIIEIHSTSTGNQVIVTFKDNGTGIPENVLEKIFNPFFTTKSIGKGTGLGLSICQNIIESHDGTITVSNAVEGGAVFTISLPCQMI